MQQLEPVNSQFIASSCDDVDAVEQQAAELAGKLGAELSEQSEGADVWFACLRLEGALIQLHYDWFSGGFWLTATGPLADDPAQWQQLLLRLD
ncbi:DUF3630 family protein [Neiella marina]|uniref:DUF3630 family protein n=1 Tax=Neiella holothuriorum TaxID=2870530 RepID=A0ABS7ECM7_9GAMM|nr:DUF3630 family protein [Neiella holothuriorum]MBW8189974.1 DUF3630 family protein [Neiella holothuriorum]